MFDFKTVALVFLVAAISGCDGGAGPQRPGGDAGSRMPPEPTPETTSKVKATTVSTFHCLSLYWSPEKGAAGKPVTVKYRRKGDATWRDGMALRHHPIDVKECQADYRGSIVNLTPGTPYEIVLDLKGTGERTVLNASTWSEMYPIASTVKCAGGAETLIVDKSGTPDGYILYDGTGATIDVAKKKRNGIEIKASYVIVRGFTIRNVVDHAVRIRGGHHIVIEDCEMTQWGRHDEKGFGRNYQAGVYGNRKDIHSVVVQRCKMHHPSWDSNSWAEDHNGSRHPSGPQCIVLFNSSGNHVFRYNEFWSDPDHYYNDVLGAGSNGSYRGFPGPDSDIYGNYVANCWDDGLEIEGSNTNVRVWNNYIEETMIPIANAATSIGPLYVWRNVSGRSFSAPGSQWGLTHGASVKMGFAGGEKWMTGTMYFFNNTTFQPKGEGADGLGGSSRVIKHCTTRNNIFHVRDTDTRSISTGKSEDNDFDHDLVSARVPEGHEKNGVRGKPKYTARAGFNFETKTGNFQLAPDSPGFDKGVVIPNFCEAYNGAAPDMGAHEAGSKPMQVGVKAKFVPPTK